MEPGGLHGDQEQIFRVFRAHRDFRWDKPEGALTGQQCPQPALFRKIRLQLNSFHITPGHYAQDKETAKRPAQIDPTFRVVHH